MKRTLLRGPALAAAALVAGCAPWAGGSTVLDFAILDDGPALAHGLTGEHRQVAGCWRFEAGRRLRTHLPRGGLLHLDTARLDAGNPGFRRVRSSAEPGPDLSGWGVFAEGDSVLVSVGSGYSGMVARLARRGDRMVGHGRTWEDYVPHVSYGGRVRAQRVPCEGNAS